jgi:translocation and assembly module TamA
MRVQRWADGRLRLAGGLLALFTLTLSGCASLGHLLASAPSTAESRAQAGAAATTSPAPPPAASEPAAASGEPPADRRRVPVLTVEAPGELKPLLERNLDIGRAIHLPDAGGISEAEWSRLIAAAPAQARTLAQTDGFFSADATVARASGPPPQVTLSLSPGPRAEVGKLTLEVQGELADLAQQQDPEAVALRQRFERNWGLPVGSAFVGNAWSDAQNNALALLRSQGYASATWSGTGAEVDTYTQKARLFLVVDSGPLFRAGDIEVEGLVKHPLDQVKGLAGFARGSALTEERLLDYQQRLQKTGLFDQVVVSLDPDTVQAGAARVLVKLKEAPLQGATLAVGVSANTGPRATVDNLHRQVFGFNATARNKFEWGRDKQAWNGEVSTHLNEEFNRDLVGGSVERLLTDTDLVMSQRLRAGRSKESPDVERLNFVELERARECGRLDGMTTDCADLRSVSLQQHRIWRELDDNLLPTRGYSVSGQAGVGVADGTASDRGGFVRLYGRATGYWPLGEHWFSQARLELGGVLMRSGVQVPDSLRFRAGGDESVRGYAWRSLAPVRDDGTLTGGKYLMTASAEIARPITAALPSVWWAAFIDGGRAADELRDLKPALGYGLGVRWRSPVGPLKLDWAWGREVGHARLHLSVGITF